MAAAALRRWCALRTLHPSAGNISTVKGTRVLRRSTSWESRQPLCPAGLAHLAVQDAKQAKPKTSTAALV
jgi:hypothetical protein